MIDAKLILHSKAPHGDELISIEAYAPYFLDAEIEKHGQICSNSSSNRAIPFNKMMVADYYIPTDVRKNQSGMQGTECLSDGEIEDWYRHINDLRDYTVIKLNAVYDTLNVHKQHLNRYLAPWSMQRKILTGTREAWNNVMELRDHPDADPNIQIWAKKIHKILVESNPTNLDYGEWHLPYITKKDAGEVYEYFFEESVEETLLKISAARCARTSYRLFDGSDTTVDKDLKLFDKLVGQKPYHATPLEHQGLCIKPREPEHPHFWDRGITHIMRDGQIGSGRLTGWVQYRHWYDYAPSSNS